MAHCGALQYVLAFPGCCVALQCNCYTCCTDFHEVATCCQQTLCVEGQIQNKFFLLAKIWFLENIYPSALTYTSLCGCSQLMATLAFYRQLRHPYIHIQSADVNFKGGVEPQDRISACRRVQMLSNLVARCTSGCITFSFGANLKKCCVCVTNCWQVRRDRMCSGRQKTQEMCMPTGHVN